MWTTTLHRQGPLSFDRIPCVCIHRTHGINHWGWKYFLPWDSTHLTPHQEPCGWAFTQESVQSLSIQVALRHDGGLSSFMGAWSTTKVYIIAWYLSSPHVRPHHQRPLWHLLSGACSTLETTDSKLISSCSSYHSRILQSSSSVMHPAMWCTTIRASQTKTSFLPSSSLCLKIVPRDLSAFPWTWRTDTGWINSIKQDGPVWKRNSRTPCGDTLYLSILRCTVVDCAQSTLPTSIPWRWLQTPTSNWNDTSCPQNLSTSPACSWTTKKWSASCPQLQISVCFRDSFTPTSRASSRAYHKLRSSPLACNIFIQ